MREDCLIPGLEDNRNRYDHGSSEKGAQCESEDNVAHYNEDLGCDIAIAAGSVQLLSVTLMIRIVRGAPLSHASCFSANTQ